MKLRYSLFTIFAAAALFAGCSVSDVTDYMMATESGTYSLEQEAGEVTVKFKSPSDWKAELLPSSVNDEIDDATFSPASGKGSSSVQEIKVKFGANAGYDRTAVLSIFGEGVSAAVNITQHGPKGEFMEEITCAEFLKRPVDSKVWYVLSGKVTKIEKGAVETDQYSNFYINDGSITNGDGAYIYGLYDGKDGAQFKTAPARLYELGITVGYTVTVATTRGEYKGTIEGVGTYIISYDPPTDPILTCAKTSLTVNAKDTVAVFNITAMNIPGWTVTAGSDATWVTKYTQGGTTSGELRVSIPENTTTKSRTATFTVAAEGLPSITLTVTQRVPEPDVITDIAAVKDSTVGATLRLHGTVVMTTGGSNGYILGQDGSYVYVYYNNTYAVGDSVKTVGNTSLFSSTLCLQFAPFFEEKLGTGKFKTSNPKVLDAAALTTMITGASATAPYCAEYVQVDGTIFKDGSYANGKELAGTTYGARFYAPSGLNINTDEYFDKKAKLTGWIVGYESNKTRVRFFIEKIEILPDGGASTN